MTMGIIRKDSKQVAVPADFQTATVATGFGKYNIILLLICIPTAWTLQFESTVMSFIIPAATCDLNLSPYHKGLLNSMAVIGMISSGFIWGILLDTMGRKKILFLGLIIEGLLVIGKSLSQEFYVLSACTFLGGTVTGGTYIALNTYLLEFHSTEYRGKIQMMHGMMYCAANIAIPLLSAAILPLKIYAKIFFIDFYAWNLLILITSTTSIISAICFYFLPESPKFLMSIGNNDEALEVFKTIYRINSGRSKETYPINNLIKEIDDQIEMTTNKKSWAEYAKMGWQQMSPLFGRQYAPKLILASSVHGIFQMAINVIRFYMPQVFQANHEYQVANNGTTTNICNILALLRARKQDEDYVCSVNLENNFNVYLNSVILGIVALISYGLVGSLINIFGRKRLLVTLGIVASLTISCMYFSNGTITTLSLSSIYLATAGICFDLFISIVMVMFPTTLRAMAFSMCLLFGRTLTVAGNMIFPILVEVGCGPPFWTMGGAVLVAVLLVYLIPNMDKVDMK